jgi:hypothetical protein
VLQEWRFVLEVFIILVYKKYIKDDVRCVPTEWLWNAGIIKPELLNELRTEVFDKIGFKLLCWKPFDKSYGKELINHFDFKFEEKDKRQHDGGVSILYGDKFIKKITAISTTAGIEVIDDKHSLLHNLWIRCIINIWWIGRIKRLTKRLMIIKHISPKTTIRSRRF